jgi:putative phage-type endonuclease
MDVHFLEKEYKNPRFPLNQVFQGVLNEVEALREEPEVLVALKLREKQLLKTIEETQKTERLRKQVLYLRNVPQPEQRSQAWYSLREGMFTASSDIGMITGDSYDHKTAKSAYAKEKLINTLLLKKCGHDLKKFTGNAVTRHGNKYENIVSKIYEQKYNTRVWEFGLIQHPAYSYIGASPDGITPDGVMVEIKCPQMRKINGIVPRYYWCQVQVQLEVADLEECDFFEAVFDEVREEDLQTTSYDYSGVLGEMYKCSCGIEDCICYENPDNRTFIYPDISKNYMVQRQEIKNVYNNKYIHTHKFKRSIYWVLKEHSNIRVQRDREWFNTHISAITDTWNKVLELRKDQDKLLQVLSKTRKEDPEEYPFDE